jgi:hypothetical protein
VLRYIPRPTKGALGAAGLGAALPFLLAAQGPGGLPAEVTQALPWWAVVALSAAGPTLAWAASVALSTALRMLAAGLRARGKARLANADPKDDATGEGEIAAADAADRAADKLLPPRAE